MHSRVYETSVCLSHRQTTAVMWNGFVVKCPVGRRYQTTAAGSAAGAAPSSGAAAQRSAANACSVMLTADVGSWSQTCFLSSVRSAALHVWQTDWLSCGLMSHSTQNRSFRRRFPNPISWLGMEKTKPNTTKARIHQSNVLQHKINTKK